VRKRADSWRSEYDAPARVLVTNDGDIAFEWFKDGNLSGLTFSFKAELYGEYEKPASSIYYKEMFGVKL
jgi:hypothetical protein